MVVNVPALGEADRAIVKDNMLGTAVRMAIKRTFPTGVACQG